MATPIDDLGAPYSGARPARRVVSLVPSLTEALATVPDAAGLVGATTWCTHPEDLGVARVRGTKNPDLTAIRALEPDVVVANREENRELDVRRLRESGVPVWVTDIRTVTGAVGSLERLFDGLGWGAPDWLVEVARLFGGPLPEVTRRVAVPIWRDPWMVVGSDTFASDLLRHLGWENAFGLAPERYPRVSSEDIDGCGADVILLPDEPYAFTTVDGPEAFRTTPTELVSGRLLTWYGPSLVEAARLAR